MGAGGGRASRFLARRVRGLSWRGRARARPVGAPLVKLGTCHQPPSGATRRERAAIAGRLAAPRHRATPVDAFDCGSRDPAPDVEQSGGFRATEHTLSLAGRVECWVGRSRLGPTTLLWPWPRSQRVASTDTVGRCFGTRSSSSRRPRVAGRQTHRTPSLPNSWRGGECLFARL